MKLISRAGKIDAPTVGKLYQAVSAARSKDAIIAAIGTDALQSSSTTLAEMTAKIENYERTSLATDLLISEATQNVLMASTPMPPRYDNNKTPLTVSYKLYFCESNPTWPASTGVHRSLGTIPA